jgi:hypothetical protein
MSVGAGSVWSLAKTRIIASNLEREYQDDVNLRAEKERRVRADREEKERLARSVPTKASNDLRERKTLEIREALKLREPCKKEPATVKPNQSPQTEACEDIVKKGIAEETENESDNETRHESPDESENLHYLWAVRQEAIDDLYAKNYPCAKSYIKDEYYGYIRQYRSDPDFEKLVDLKTRELCVTYMQEEYQRDNCSHYGDNVPDDVLATQREFLEDIG